MKASDNIQVFAGEPVMNLNAPRPVTAMIYPGQVLTAGARGGGTIELFPDSVIVIGESAESIKRNLFNEPSLETRIIAMVKSYPYLPQGLAAKIEQMERGEETPNTPS